MMRISFDRICRGVTVRNLIVAALVGVVAAGVVSLFHHAMYLLMGLFFPHSPHAFIVAAAELPKFERLITPCIGGLVAGIILWYYQRHEKPSLAYPTNYIYAIRHARGRFNSRSCLIKSVATLIVTSSGGAIGREGAMILLASMSTSLMVPWMTLRRERHLWVCCGVAAGMASAYLTPLMGVCFVIEIIIGRGALPFLLPMIVSSLTAAYATQLFNGLPGFLYPAFSINSLPLWSAALLLLAAPFFGLMGYVFLKMLERARALFKCIPLVLPLRFALGGLVVGGLSIFTPFVWGNGHGAILAFLVPQNFTWQLVLSILLLKLFAIVTINSAGVPGGIFTPTLFIGASLGLLLGKLMALTGWLMIPGLTTALTVIGLGGVLASTLQAPFTASLAALEMTGQYQLCITIVISCLIASRIGRLCQQYGGKVAQH